MGPTKANTQVAQASIPLWMQVPIDQEQPQTPELDQQAPQEQPMWMRVPVDQGPKEDPVYSNIDPDLEAPALVRAQVGALDKPEDRLTAIRKHYPDAEPYQGDNFIMTDPKTGKVMLYNQPGWLPTSGDIASILPEVGEGIGAVGGAVGGGAMGTGVAPGPGTVVGGMIGAGAGATAGRELTQRGLNWAFGNEDTRTGGEQAWDATKTFLVNGAGEGVGMALAPVAGKVARGVSNFVGDSSKKLVAGTADDAASAAQRAADLRGIGAEPTAGMVNGSPVTAVKEQALAATRTGKPIQDRISQAFDAMGNEANRIVSGITPQTLSRQELGQALKDQAEVLKGQIKDRGDYLYSRVGEKTGNAPALGNNTRSYLDQLQVERKAMGKSASLNNGSSVDQVIKQAKAITDDIGSGVNFNTLKEARTNIRLLKDDRNLDPILRDRYNGLYQALTADMGETAASSGDDALQAWRKANNYSFRNSKGSWSTKGSIDELANKTPEAAADWVLQQVNKGGTRLNAVRRQIERTEGGADVWNALTGSSVERMGVTRGTDGVESFNPTQMLKQWTNLSPEAKDAMFHGTARAQYRQDLDRLARVADNMKNYRRLDNHSNTTKAAGALKEVMPVDTKTLWGAMLLGPKAFAISAAGKTANLGYKKWQAKMLTDPRTVNWLANIPASQMQKGGLKAHVARLAQIGASTTDNALATAIDSYLREVGYSD